MKCFRIIGLRVVCKVVQNDIAEVTVHNVMVVVHIINENGFTKTHLKHWSLIILRMKVKNSQPICKNLYLH
jgi:hypothetical protein